MKNKHKNNPNYPYKKGNEDSKSKLSVISSTTAVVIKMEKKQSYTEDIHRESSKEFAKHLEERTRPTATTTYVYVPGEKHLVGVDSW